MQWGVGNWLDPKYRSAITSLLSGGVVLLLILLLKEFFEQFEDTDLCAYTGWGDDFLHSLDAGADLAGPLFIGLHLVRLFLIYIAVEFFPPRRQDNGSGGKSINDQ